MKIHKNKQRILASVEETRDFLRCLVFIAIALHNKTNNKRFDSNATLLERWMPNALKVLNRYGIDKKLFQATLNSAKLQSNSILVNAKTLRDALAASSKIMEADLYKFA